MNIDPRNSSARPSATYLKSIGVKMVRFLYDVSWETGSLDFDRAYNFYSPYIRELRAAGISVIVVINHETYGEGHMSSWNMSFQQWSSYSAQLVSLVRQHIVEKFRGLSLIYQIWNEQDADPGAEASVHVPPESYRVMLQGAYQMIKGVDSSATVITGGFMRGPGIASDYIRKMPGGIAGICDGLALHEYGSDTPLAPYPGNQTGHITNKLAFWKSFIGSIPIWITEWGVLDNPNAPESVVVKYAKHFMDAVRSKVVCALWFAFGVQHNCWPAMGHPALLEVLRWEAAENPQPTGQKLKFNTVMNIRADAGTDKPVVGKTFVGEVGELTDLPAKAASGYVWLRLNFNGDDHDGWVAMMGVDNMQVV